MIIMTFMDPILDVSVFDKVPKHPEERKETKLSGYQPRTLCSSFSTLSHTC